MRSAEAAGEHSSAITIYLHTRPVGRSAGAPPPAGLPPVAAAASGEAAGLVGGIRESNTGESEGKKTEQERRAGGSERQGG